VGFIYDTICENVRKTAYNSTFAIGGVKCFYDTFVVNGSAVLRMNICAENPAHRKSAKRYVQGYDDRVVKNIKLNE